jgi:hypothetical protein
VEISNGASKYEREETVAAGVRRSLIPGEQAFLCVLALSLRLMRRFLLVQISGLFPFRPLIPLF